MKVKVLFVAGLIASAMLTSTAMACGPQFNDEGYYMGNEPCEVAEGSGEGDCPDAYSSTYDADGKVTKTCIENNEI